MNSLVEFKYLKNTAHSFHPNFLFKLTKRVQLVIIRCFIHISYKSRKINVETMSSPGTQTESNQQINLQRAYPWIDNHFFEELLRADFPTENIVVQNFFLRAALAKGENYSSQMIRAKVNYVLNKTNQQMNFIIKTAIADEGLDEKMASERKELFNKEILAYDEVLTKVHDLLKGIGDTTKLHGR